jgi:hypothetical protein
MATPIISRNAKAPFSLRQNQRATRLGFKPTNEGKSSFSLLSINPEEKPNVRE